jgi:heat-inducible transcriptional repressor
MGVDMRIGDAEHRRRAVLETIVEHHVLTAQPVCSTTVARRSGLRVSPATIRTTMAELESAGLLCQPYVSAGRIPTDKGYRIYVDKLMKVKGLTRKEREVISQELEGSSRDAVDILRIACNVLSRIWGLLAVGLGPGIAEGILRRVDFIPVVTDRVLVVVSIVSGILKTIMIEIDRSVDPDVLDDCAREINERLAGLSLATAIQVMAEEPSRFSRGDHGVKQVIIRLVEGISKPGLGEELHLEGTHRILVQPEFESRDLVGAFLSVVEAKEPLIRELSLSRFQPEPRVMIGRENTVSELMHCSLVTAGYRVGRVSGAVGVLGPIRMPYSKLIPAVEYVAAAMGSLLS